MPSSITLTVAHLPTSTSFFLSALQPLNYIYRGKVNNTVGFGLPDTPPDFWLTQEIPGVPASAAHVAFPAVSREQVQKFFVTAIKAGAKCHGEPMCRDPISGYYSSAVIDLDGNSIEAVYRPDLVGDSSDESQSGSVVSSGSNSSKSSMSPRAPTVASHAKASSTASKSKAPTTVSKAKVPTTVSSVKAPTVVRDPTVVSSASAKTSKTSSHAPSVVRSVAPSQAQSSTSSARPQSTTSRSPQEAVPAAATVTTAPNGDVITNMMYEARGAMNVARELVDQVRPHLASTNSTPNVRATEPQSHQPSDTIVGTLLGVAAGAALHYAYSKATQVDQSASNSAPVTRRPSFGDRSTMGPQLTAEQYYYYEQQVRSNAAPAYRTIEAPPSAYSVHSQKYITMDDHGERISDYASTIRPRRRSSFDGSRVSSTRDSHVSAARSTRMIEGPPTSYRAPTAITSAESNTTHRSRSKSRLSSVVRAASLSSSSRRHKADDDDQESISIRSHTSRRSSRAPSAAVTAIRDPPSAPRSRATSTSRHSRAHSPHSTPLPPSRAATWTGDASSANDSAFSTHSKSAKTVVGKLRDIERAAAAIDGGSSTAKSRMTKSVVGKVKDIRNLDLPGGEVGPDDSVSQISSNTGSRSSRRSRR